VRKRRHICRPPQESYTQMERARERVLELLYHLHHRLAYKKRTEIVVEVVAQLEEEGGFPRPTMPLIWCAHLELTVSLRARANIG